MASQPCKDALATSPRAIFDRAALLTQEGVMRLLKTDANEQGACENTPAFP